MDTNLITSKMQKVVEIVSSDVGGIRTGRVTASLVENIACPAYGGTQILKIIELASITTPDAQTLVISPWDKSIIGDIKKGLLDANLGINPVISSNGRSASGGDGEIIRISFPPLTTEDREKYVKILSQKIENGKIMIRQIRGDVMQDIKKSFENKELTEDEKFAQEKKLQELTDKFVAMLEGKEVSKKEELLQI